MDYEVIIAGEFVDKVVPLIDLAKNTINICVFDWRWYTNDPGSPAQKFNQSIVSAVRRGVKVQALVNSESVASSLRAVGVETKKHLSSRLLHLKMIVIDDKVVVTGSHNFTQSAFTSNYELSVAISNIEPNSSFSQFFYRLWQSQ